MKTSDIKSGDIFAWDWNENAEKELKTAFQAGTAYWCMDRYCVAVEDGKNNIILVDTYNYNQYASDNLFDYESLYNEYMKVINPEKVELTFLGNVNDYECLNPTDSKDYHHNDILIIPCHAGYRTVYLKRKGAEKSNDVIINKLENQILQWECDIGWMQRNIDFAKERIEEMKNE